MKKFIAMLLSLALLATASGLCVAENTEALRVVVTIFPIYDWVREIAGERAQEMQLRVLQTSGVDMHNYQPSAEDIVAVSDCDLFIAVGGASDAWVDDVLRTAQNENLVALNLLEVLGSAVKAEETVEGMEPEEEEEEEEADEHVWLSLRNARVCCRELAAQLGALDAAHAGEYAANAGAYCAKLDALDARYREAVEASANRTLLFGDRFPFRYLVDDYGLEYYAAFSGCSAESEASFETVAFLASKLDELHLPAVLTLEGSDHRIAETVVAASSSRDADIVEMNSMQSVTLQEIEDGANYLDIMEGNLASLTQALNGSGE